MDSKQAFLAVTFFIRDTLCGLDTDRIQEVVKLGKVTPVHHANPYVVGVINLRGRIITIVDLGLKIGFDPSLVTEDTRVLIVPWSGEHVGILVDRVSDVVHAESGELAERPTVAGGIPARYFIGVLNSYDRLIGILDMDSILALTSEIQGAS